MPRATPTTEPNLTLGVFRNHLRARGSRQGHARGGSGRHGCAGRRGAYCSVRGIERGPGAVASASSARAIGRRGAILHTGANGVARCRVASPVVFTVFERRRTGSVWSSRQNLRRSSSVSSASLFSLEHSGGFARMTPLRRQRRNRPRCRPRHHRVQHHPPNLRLRRHRRVRLPAIRPRHRRTCRSLSKLDGLRGCERRLTESPTWAERWPKARRSALLRNGACLCGLATPVRFLSR